MKRTPDHSADALQLASPDANTCSECGSRPRLGALKICKSCLITSSELNRRARADAEQRAREKTAAKQIAEGETKTCRCCKTEKPLSLFQKWATAKDGHRRDCIECVSTGATKTKTKRKATAKGKARKPPSERKAQTAQNRLKHRAHVKDWERRNPAAIRAKRALAKAIDIGTVARPSRCQVKGCSHRGPIHAHHHNYDLPLAVSWLCPSHHRQRHNGNPITLITGLPEVLAGVPATNLKETIRHAFDTKNKARRQARPQARTPRRPRSASATAAE